MANANKPNGLRPVGTLGSAGYKGAIQVFSTSTSDAAAIGVGDPVTLSGTANADGVPEAIRAVAGTSVAAVGVMVGIVPDPTNLTKTYRAASTAQLIYVDTDPMTIYEVQETGTTAMAITAVGANLDLVMGSVNTTTGYTGATIATTAATTANLPIKLLRLSPKVDNAVGQYAKWQVLLNNNAYKTNVAI